MAVVKIRKVKATLAKSIAYVTDPAKTDGQRLASTTTGHDIADCDAIAAAFLNNLESTKGGSARKGAVLALHVIQSFDPDDPITPEQAHSLGERFVQEITAGRHDYVIATHTDRAHVHNHILICPADLTTGRAMRLTRGTLGRWRQVSDRLCEENGLKVIDPTLGGRVSPDLAQLYASARGENAKDRVRALIDQACMASRGFDAFRRELERRGVRVTVRGRRLTYTVLASGMRFSDRRLGVAYNMLAVMGKLERCVVHEIGFHDSLVARRTRTAVTVRVPGTRGRLRLTIPVERTIRDGQVWRAYLADGTRQVLTDARGRYAMSVPCTGLYEWFARPDVRLEDYCRRRFADLGLEGLDRRTIAQALAADRLADTLRELKVLVEAAKAGEARGEAFARLRSDAEAGGRRMLALMVALAEARDQGDDIRPLETELAAEERRTGELAADALALRRLIERERPGQSRDDGSRARTVRRRTR